MILFGLSLCPLLTFAFIFNDTYVECFTDNDCMKYFPENNKNYCYYGTCTDRCPPGYKKGGIGDQFIFTCECDTEAGLVPNGNFGSVFQNVDKCRCNQTYCLVTVYAQGLGYTDGLIPHGAPPNCKIQLDDIPSPLTEFSFYMLLISMLIFMFIHCRSSSGVVYDFHRYYGLYVLGSLMVIVFVQTVYPFTAGFTRSMAFGIVAHNSMEWNLLVRLQYGKTSYVRNSSNIWLIMYFIIMLLAMARLPLAVLLYFAMIQGGFLDWTFVCFIFAARKTVREDKSHPQYIHQCCKDEYSRFVCWYGFGAIFHLVSVEILFAGFILNNAWLIALGGFFLLPTFLFYTIWVFGQERLMVFFGPSVFMNYVKGGDFSESVPKFQMVPFKHTTRTVDILWKRLVGEGCGPIQKLGVEMEPLQSVHVVRVGDDNQKEFADAEPSQVRTGSTSGTFEIEDCESFKFGIDDQCLCCTLPRVNCCCKNWVPFYWVIAFICISANTLILFFLPTWIEVDGCNEGYDYGAW